MQILAAFIASSAMLGESVRIYVIAPASYSFWASFIHTSGDIPSRADASCCKVDVINGGLGLRLLADLPVLATCQIGASGV